MDTFSHTLWGWGLFGQRGRPWTAALAGSMPDMIPFVPFIVMRWLEGHPPGRPPLSTIPTWTFASYNVTHSLIVAFAAILIVSRFRKDLAFALLAWPCHIFLDIPFHTARFFPTPMFWPVSHFTIDGISWGHPIVWYPNLAGVLILTGWRLRQSWQRRNHLHHRDTEDTEKA